MNNGLLAQKSKPVEATDNEDDLSDPKERTTSQKWARLAKIDDKISELKKEREEIRDDLKKELEKN